MVINPTLYSPEVPGGGMILFRPNVAMLNETDPLSTQTAAAYLGAPSGGFASYPRRAKMQSACG